MFDKTTIADVFRPQQKILGLLYNILVVFGASLFIALCAQIRIWLPFSPVPVTGQTFAVLLSAMLLGPALGCFSVIIYLLQGVAGLAVFATPGPGLLALLAGPTGGYLLGFVPAACATGCLARRGWDRNPLTTIAAMAIGNLIIYSFGLVRLCSIMGFKSCVLSTGLYPFLIGDCLKILLAALVLPSSWRLLKKLRGS